MASVTITISGLSKQYTDLGLSKDSPRLIALTLDSLLYQVAQGVMANGNPNLSLSTSASDAVFASQTYTISGGSGTLTFTIGGTGVTQAFTTSDANSATLAAAAINANTTVNKLVSATAAGNKVTVTALVPGAVGNKITTTASGTGNTAGGATLVNGAGADTAVMFNGAI